MNSLYDVIVIGGGHNGLVAAAYLARRGQRTLLVERRNHLGGVAATEEIAPGYLFDTGSHDAGLFRARIASELGLHKHGVEFLKSRVASLSLLPNGGVLPLHRDLAESLPAIERHSSVDAGRYAAFANQLRSQAAILSSALDLIPPELPFHGYLSALPGTFGWLRLALRVRRYGRRALYEFMRTLPMPAEQLLDEWFEGEALKGTLASGGVSGSMQGPKAPGTALMMIYHAVAGFPRGRSYVRGGMGALAAGLARVAEARGVQIRTSVGVERVLVDDYRAVGVRLSTGEEIRCEAVAAATDPRHTLFDLVGAPELELRVVRRTRNIRFRGSTAKVNLALAELPQFSGVEDEALLTGRILVSPSVDYLERAYDDAKYGRWSARPYLDMAIPTLTDPSLAPSGHHVLSVTVQYTPYRLAEGEWDGQREALGDHVVATIAEYAPRLPRLILHRHVLTPLDYERDYGLPEGSIYHGQMAMDQLLAMRPIPGYGRYRSPVDGVYFCGAGAHPGGGVTGAPGRNAAQIIAKDLRRAR